LDEVVGLAGEKGALYWKAQGTLEQGWLFALTGKASDAVHKIISGLAEWQSTGSTLLMPFNLSCLARAYAELGKFDGAWRCIGEAMRGCGAIRESNKRPTIYSRRSTAGSPRASTRSI
jgi:hypothetical protein